VLDLDKDNMEQDELLIYLTGSDLVMYISARQEGHEHVGDLCKGDSVAARQHWHR
jgi:hypothetical protein